MVAKKTEASMAKVIAQAKKIFAEFQSTGERYHELFREGFAVILNGLDQDWRKLGYTEQRAVFKDTEDIVKDIVVEAPKHKGLKLVTFNTLARQATNAIVFEVPMEVALKLGKHDLGLCEKHALTELKDKPGSHREKMVQSVAWFKKDKADRQEQLNKGNPKPATKSATKSGASPLLTPVANPDEIDFNSPDSEKVVWALLHKIITDLSRPLAQPHLDKPNLVSQFLKKTLKGAVTLETARKMGEDIISNAG